ncbi:MAG TPA: hypothetical protein ENF16_06360 [Bacteroidetes bacterium]|nr:hypothetical protein [Bacteroidota bacterium]
MADNLKTNPLHEIDRPIFIIGTGRSGTTFLFHIMRRHPQLAWLCQYRTQIGLNRYDRIVTGLKRIPILGHIQHSEFCGGPGRSSSPTHSGSASCPASTALVET